LIIHNSIRCDRHISITLRLVKAFESSGGRHNPSVSLLVDWGIHISAKEDAMPDFEIRYYRPDGSLALVQITIQPSEQHAREYAQRHQGEHARFELRQNGPQTQR
jgi:hypothetical protein